MIATTLGSEAAPQAMDDVRRIPHENLHPSPTNPRKDFKAEPLLELSRSIEAIGIKQPLLVRPMQGMPGHFEIIAGERRWRGNGLALERVEQYEDAAALHAKLALLAEPRCIVEELSDEAVLELQLIENLQREDLSAREEADGYAALLALQSPDGGTVYTVEKIAERINRTVNHVRQRMKLRQAPKSLLEACEKGAVALRVCEMVGRVPDPKAREDLAQRILNPQFRSRDLPLTVKETSELIRGEYMIALKGCGFDPTDAELVPVRVDDGGRRCFGGACGDCPFRSGNDESLQDDLWQQGKGKGSTAGHDANVCTMPACYRAKQNAAWKSVERSAEAGGQHVLSVTAAEREFDGASLTIESEYVDLNDKPGYRDTRRHDNEGVKKWEKLLKGAPAEITVTVARNPHTGSIHRLVKRSEAIEAVKLKDKADGKTSMFEKASANGGLNDAFRQQQKEIEAKNKLAKIEAGEALNALGEEVAKKGFDNDQGFEVLKVLLGNLSADAVRIMGRALKIQPLKKGDAGHSGSGRDFLEPILDHFSASGVTMPKLHAYLVMAVAADCLQFVSGVHPAERVEKFMILANAFALDMKAVKALAKVEAGEKGKPKKAAVSDLKKRGRIEAADARFDEIVMELDGLAEKAGNMPDGYQEWIDAVAKEAGLPSDRRADIPLPDYEKLLLAAREAVRGLGSSEGGPECETNSKPEEKPAKKAAKKAGKKSAKKS